MLVILCLGLASGIPLGVTLTLVQAWMTKFGVDLKTIGLAGLVGMPYTVKFVWAPFMDRFVPPFLGRRRGWMLLAQLLMMASIGALGFFNPTDDLMIILSLACVVSFAGASHDIVIDAYRRDILEDSQLGFGSAVATNSYLIGYKYLATVLGLYLGDVLPWHLVFLVLASVCALGMVGTFLAKNPKGQAAPPKNIRDAIVLPFLDYLKRPGAWEILLFILLYKIGDNLASNLMTPFYLKIGFSLKEIAVMAKAVGFWCMFGGGLIGGILLARYSIRTCLLGFGILQALSTLAFVWLAQVGNSLQVLGVVVGFENLTAGMGSAAFSAFMLRLCNVRFSATQFALLTSFMGIPRTIIPSIAGFIAEPLGWSAFFTISTVIAIPGLLMILFRAKKWEKSAF